MSTTSQVAVKAQRQLHLSGMSASLISKFIPKLKVREYYLTYWISKAKLIKLKDQTLMFQFMTHLEGKSLNFVLIFP